MAHGHGGGGGGGHGAGGFVQEDEILGKAYDAELTRRLIGYLGPYMVWVIVALALLLAMSLAQIAPPIIAKYIVDQAVIPAVNGELGRAEAFARLALLGVLYLLVLRAVAAHDMGRAASDVRPAARALPAPAVPVTFVL